MDLSTTINLDLLTTIYLASVDAINPCSISIQAALLSMLLTKSRKNALIGGLLFSITVIIMYALYGLVLHQIISIFYNIVKTFLIALLVILIILEFNAYFNYKPGILSVEMPTFLRPYVHKIITKAYSPWMAIPVAILISLFLLPCSSGPYIIFLGLQKTLNYLFIIYLLVFASPFFAVTFLVYFTMKPEKVMEWRNKHVRELHLISGILLLAVLIYLLI